MVASPCYQSRILYTCAPLVCLWVWRHRSFLHLGSNLVGGRMQLGGKGLGVSPTRARCLLGGVKQMYRACVAYGKAQERCSKAKGGAVAR